MEFVDLEVRPQLASLPYAVDAQSELIACAARMTRCAVARKFKITLDEGSARHKELLEQFSDCLNLNFPGHCSFVELPPEEYGKTSFQMVANDDFWQGFKRWLILNLESTCFSVFVDLEKLTSYFNPEKTIPDFFSRQLSAFTNVKHPCLISTGTFAAPMEMEELPAQIA